MDYTEGAKILVVESLDRREGVTDGFPWTVYTRVCEADGIYYDDEDLGNIDSPSVIGAQNIALTAALLHGYEPTETKWHVNHRDRPGAFQTFYVAIQDAT